MNQMLKLASLSGVALGILSTVAVAADLPRRSPPPPFVPPPPAFTWTGFYAGLNAGAIINNRTEAAYLALPGFGFPFFNNTNGPRRVSFVGGGQVGYNWQTGPFVLGVEADAQFRGGPLTPAPVAGVAFVGFPFGGLGVNQDIGGHYLGTLRGRLGYAFANNWLIYATGGGAFGHTWENFGFARTFNAGYTLGGGVEYAITPNWSIKAEYLFVDLGRNKNFNAFAFAAANPFAGFGNGFNSPFRSQAHIARLGVNYHFNLGGVLPSPVVARY
jgi:outer membrane immunogenic protein